MQSIKEWYSDIAYRYTDNYKVMSSIKEWYRDIAYRYVDNYPV